MQDLVVHNFGVGTSGNAALGDLAPASESSSTMSPGVSRSYLSGPPDSSSSPMNWRRVEDEAESTRSQVIATERLLHETLSLVHRNILHPVLVSVE
jgi:hypothetical protein